MKEYIVAEDSYAYEMRRFDELKELIRCKDCKYYTGKWCTQFSTKQFDINDIYKADDDFCSMAERRDNELRFKNCR